MLMTLSTMYCCPHCACERLKKNGHNASGSQRAQCLECRRTFVLAPKPPRYSKEEREQIVRAATCERMSTRAIRRTFGPCTPDLAELGGKKRRQRCRGCTRRFCPRKKAMCSNAMNSGALWAVRRKASAGSGLLFAAEPARWLPTCLGI